MSEATVVDNWGLFEQSVWDQRLSRDICAYGLRWPEQPPMYPPDLHWRRSLTLRALEALPLEVATDR